MLRTEQEEDCCGVALVTVLLLVDCTLLVLSPEIYYGSNTVCQATSGTRVCLAMKPSLPSFLSSFCPLHNNTPPLQQTASMRAACEGT